MKWPILFEAPGVEDERYWSEVHAEGYDLSVYTLTQDKGFLADLKSLVDLCDSRRRLLVPGCGSRVDLQMFLLDNYAAEIELIECIDFPAVIEVAGRQLESDKVVFRGCSYEELTTQNTHDAAIMINSLVSSNDVANRCALSNITRCLVPRGGFVGIFPTVLTDWDLISVGHDNRPPVDFRKNLIFEEKQNTWQLAYSPLRLRRIIKEAGLELRKMVFVFLDSAELKRQAADYYGISDPDMVIYEIGVYATKV